MVPVKPTVDEYEGERDSEGEGGFSDDAELSERPSARSLARAAARVQKVGERLVQLSADELKRVDISEGLRDAVLEAQRLQPRSEAMRRQLQFIGRLMRSEETAPIEQQLAALDPTASAARLQREAELWRDRLLAEGDPALMALSEECPQLERQPLRQLLRRIQKESAGTPTRLQGERELAASLRKALRDRAGRR